MIINVLETKCGQSKLSYSCALAEVANDNKKKAFYFHHHGSAAALPADDLADLNSCPDFDFRKNWL